MENLYEVVKENPLFRGIAAQEFGAMLACVQGRVQDYARGALLLLAGSPVDRVGLVLEGAVQVVREDSEGRQSLLAELGPGELFGEVFACVGIQCSPVTVVAAVNSRVLLLNYRRIITTCATSCAFHQRLIENMLALVARKNLQLNQKLEILSRRTTRERLRCYFDQQRQGQRRFTIPLNREELASYLCVERSALSAELSRMQRDGLLHYHKNTFELEDVP